MCPPAYYLKGAKNIFAMKPTIPRNSYRARKGLWKPMRTRRTTNQKIPFNISTTMGEKPKAMIGLTACQKCRF